MVCQTAVLMENSLTMVRYYFALLKLIFSDSQSLISCPSHGLQSFSSCFILSSTENNQPTTLTSAKITSTLALNSVVGSRGSLSLWGPFTSLRHRRSFSKVFEAFDGKINHRLSGEAIGLFMRWYYWDLFLFFPLIKTVQIINGYRICKTYLWLRI